jgi:hypothetical protein
MISFKERAKYIFSYGSGILLHIVIYAQVTQITKHTFIVNEPWRIYEGNHDMSNAYKRKGPSGTLLHVLILAQAIGPLTQQVRKCKVDIWLLRVYLSTITLSKNKGIRP